jgi:hypothetical protein
VLAGHDCTCDGTDHEADGQRISFTLSGLGDVMTQGLFDPNSENVMRGAGNRYLGDQGIDKSKVPPSLVDGNVEAEENAESIAATDADATGEPDLNVIDDEVQPDFNDDPDAAADSLMHIEVEDEGQVDMDGEPRQPE